MDFATSHLAHVCPRRAGVVSTSMTCRGIGWPLLAKLPGYRVVHGRAKEDELSQLRVPVRVLRLVLLAAERAGNQGMSSAGDRLVVAPFEQVLQCFDQELTPSSLRIWLRETFGYNRAQTMPHRP